MPGLARVLRFEETGSSGTIGHEMTTTKRGVIVLPHLKLTPSARLAQGTRPSPLVLRRTALYWDAIKVPLNDIFDIALPRTSEVQDLMAAGVLKEEILLHPKPFGIPPGVPNIVPSGREEMSAFLVRTQWELFLHHEGKEPGS